MHAWITTFTHDDKVRALLVLIFLDFILGVVAALRTRTFRLSYVSDFLKNDILFKLVPYYALYVAALVAGSTSIVLLDYGDIADIAFGIFTVAMVGSILSSLRTLGVPVVKKAPNEIAGPENSFSPA